MPHIAQERLRGPKDGEPGWRFVLHEVVRRRQVIRPAHQRIGLSVHMSELISINVRIDEFAFGVPSSSIELAFRQLLICASRVIATR